MEVDREQLRLKDDPDVLSPPSLDDAWQCGKVVVVHGYVPEAKLDVEVAGVEVVTGAPGGHPLPNGALIGLPAALTAGQKVRARQHHDGATSHWSAPITVKDHSVELPAGPPRPQVDPAPVHGCGLRTGVANLLVGSEVWITENGTEVGRVSGSSKHQGVNVAPPYTNGRQVLAFASLCGDPSPPSLAHTVQPGPSPMPVPGFLPIYTGSTQATVTNVVNGATLEFSRNGVVQFTFSSWGFQHLVDLNPPASGTDTFSVNQRLCPGDPPSGDGTTGVTPCSSLPAPGVDPVQAGDTSVRLTSFVSDARIKVFVDNIKTGDGAGPVVQLTKPVPGGATVHVLQSVGFCVGNRVQQLTAQCVAPPLGFDPTALDLFPVGTTTYDDGPFTVTSGNSQHVAGTIFYPADADGADTPFNSRLGALGRVPVVVLVHGRHGGTTSHLGYDYLQRQLARMGLVVASVDCNQSDQWGGWADNIRDRADLVIASIAHLQSFDGAHPIFAGRLDVNRLALFGHSRGGDAVVTVPEIIALPGVSIRGVIALGPVNSHASSGSPHGYPFLAILPASDGDVIDNNGAEFYDAAVPQEFKAQLYVHHANHNFFNREWLNDDTLGGLPLMSRPDHERILSAYGCAFFRHVLLGHPTLGFVDGTLRPPGVPTDNVHGSFVRAKHDLVDNHEDGNGIGLNSVSAPTAPSGGLPADEHPFSQTGVGRFNQSFFGNTIGMVAQPEGQSTGTFRSDLGGARDLRGHQIWIRAGEVYDGRAVPAGGTGFGLGLEDAKGVVIWVDSDGVGGLPRPLDRRAFDLAAWYHTDKTKTMPNTFRFPASCFTSPPRSRRKFDPGKVVAVLLRLDRGDGRPLAFDDLHLVQQ